MKGFREKLKERQKNGAHVCVGLDPLPEKLPPSIQAGFKNRDNFGQWLIDIIDSTAPYACMFKPQSAHYEALRTISVDGRALLRDIVNYIHKNYPDIPVFLDCKRGDIGRTQQRYREAHFVVDDVDEMNFNPYMGKDCMESLVDKNNLGKALVGLVYTSNPSAREMQDVILHNKKRYWHFVVEKVLGWSKDLGVVDNAGLVMAAAYSHPVAPGRIFSTHLQECRTIVGDELWFLIPGVGTQGGYIEETVMAAYTGPGSIAINSSSGIIFASSDIDYAEAAGRKAKELNEQILDAVSKTERR